MLTPNIQTIIDEAMKKLPRVVREGIHASSWERKILAIGRKHGLHVDQLEILQTELSLAVLGLTSRDEFARDTIREANISRELMNKLIEDINSEIFIPIRDYLKQNPIVSEESALEEPEELDQTEKDTLSRHGVSFGDEDDEVAIPSENSAPVLASTITSSLQQQAPEKTSVSTHTSSLGDTSSVLDIQNLSYLNDMENGDVVVHTNTSPQVQEIIPKPKEILGDSLDPNKLKSSNTENLQATIQKNSSAYEKDPYREPIE